MSKTNESEGGVRRASPNESRNEQFRKHIESKALESFGQNNVEVNREIERTTSTADLYISTDWFDIVCEVCYDWDDVLRGIGNSMLYTYHTKNTMPCVLVPAGKVKEPDVTMLRYAIPIIEVGVE